MNISRENIDAVNALIKIEIAKADYEEKVNKAIKDYRKRVNVRGFRPGHAPLDMVKKMYGKALLVEEVNKLVGDSLTNYIKENDLSILGEPLPSESMEPIDFDKEPETLEFKFDIALAPEVTLQLDKIKVPAYSLEVSEQDIDNQIKSAASRFGASVASEQVGESSMLKGKFEQEGGYTNEDALFAMPLVKDEAEKSKFIGSKVGDVVTIDINKAFPEAKDVAHLLDIKPEEAENAKGEYKFTITEITDYKDAEINQELFDKVLGKDKVSSVEEFRAKMKEIVETNDTLAIEGLFNRNLRKAIMETQNFDLPVEFLKRWLTAVNRDNDKFTPELLDTEMPKFLEDLKWQVVKNDIIKKNDLKIEQADAMAYAKKTARLQFLQYGLDSIPDEYIDNYAINMLKNEEQLRHMYEGAADDVVVNFAKGKIALDEKKVSREEFGKLFQ